MDLASLLPVAALGLRRGDSLLDTCSGPGGKALAAAQTLLPDSMLCVDHSKERLGRVAAVMDQYLRVGPSHAWALRGKGREPPSWWSKNHSPPRGPKAAKMTIFLG